MGRWRVRLLCLLVSGVAMAAHAGTLVVMTADSHGHPVSDAVVTIDRPQALAASSTHYIDQKNETFIPYVDVMHPGDSVVFRNSDNTRHHVYSFSPIGAFQFILSPGESSSPVVLSHTGTIALGCNIHDHMIAYLVVTADQAQVTNPQGQARFDDLPVGHYTVTVWHPQLWPGHPQASATVDVPAEGVTPELPFTLRLMPDPRSFVDREHLDY
ncbi:carboxypeptidase regulatory-like domain-containing protein [Dyella sp.]|uniref:carboxypeptidase regulatory-like domain-containing protein n=1 Tax=Dyella sp. TaxID=1869338 RepID=UPI002B488064|nr:carboxypeptidase regulatory-like domain-containing protein [Dyella sp.]HKT27608.1 carboxypeptidase regulatory-like domain-containing protein [Dyella sp.]